MTKLSPSTRDKLNTVSTATLATALFKRGLRNQFVQGVLPLGPLKQSMVGEAFTLRYIPAREDFAITAIHSARRWRNAGPVRCS
jgi:regulator of RNase E activity RraA